jgi:hypothetical protein
VVDLRPTIQGKEGLELEVRYCVGGVISPLLSNVALSVLDDHFAEAWMAMGDSSATRQRRRGKGMATYRLVRYADDCAPRAQKEGAMT